MRDLLDKWAEAFEREAGDNPCWESLAEVAWKVLLEHFAEAGLRRKNVPTEDRSDH